MAALTSRARVYVGRDVRIVDEQPDGIVLEGPTRLRPGHDVEVIFHDDDDARAVRARSAVVWSWAIVAVGRRGPTFRGHCTWT